MTLARTLRGRVLAPHPDAPGWAVHADALLTVDDSGRISAIADAGPDCQIPETWPGAVVMPGFVDAHLHYPQLRVTGSASGPLLSWLSSTTFPEEERFSDAMYAGAVADELCGALARAGTTLCSLYGSPHPHATELLFAALDRWGLRAQAGMTLMDRDAPSGNLLAPGAALAACRA
ncbi:MAG: amidohydrolase family protein, partial [Myxococcota bacterium]|nr:amidohydrolase family protein [Myxococcota bacterium]